MTRFFVRPDQLQNGDVLLDEDDAHHLRTVLHAQPGEVIGILDGTGIEYPATITQVGKSRVLARLGEPQTLATEPKTQITVAQALPKVADKMEQVLQRGTEIGVSAFWAFESERSLSHLSGDRASKRLTRWSGIVKTAAEQAHRAFLPKLQVSGTLRDLLTHASEFDLAIIADASEGQTPLRDIISNQPAPPRSILVFIGPESGFTDKEIAAARRANVQSVSLGPRILRTETAALVFVSQVLYALE